MAVLFYSNGWHENPEQGDIIMIDAVKKHYPLALSLFIAFVFIQSLFYKFSGAAESIYIFQTLENWSGLSFFEPAMRYVVGTGELIASLILLFLPRYRWFGAGMALVTMTGAISFHLFTPLGIVVFDDGGTLFIMACLVWLSSFTLLWHQRHHVLSFLHLK